MPCLGYRISEFGLLMDPEKQSAQLALPKRAPYSLGLHRVCKLCHSGGSHCSSDHEQPKGYETSSQIVLLPLKKAFAYATVLLCLDPYRPFDLEVDAVGTGLSKKTPLRTKF